MTSEPKELELTPDLLEYAKAVEGGPQALPGRAWARPTAAKSDLDEGP